MPDKKPFISSPSAPAPGGRLSEIVQSVEPSTCDSVATNDGLVAALTHLRGRPFAGTPQWEAIGAQVLYLAERDVCPWPRHSAEYSGAFTFGCIDFLVRRTTTVLNARSPWGLLITTGRRHAKSALGAEMACGLTARDPVTHRRRYADAATVISLAALAHHPAYATALT
jgi:hypothetical protein